MVTTVMVAPRCAAHPPLTWERCRHGRSAPSSARASPMLRRECVATATGKAPHAVRAASSGSPDSASDAEAPPHVPFRSPEHRLAPGALLVDLRAQPGPEWGLPSTCGQARDEWATAAGVDRKTMLRMVPDRMPRM